MARSRTYSMPHRRRHEQRTNYEKRLGLLKSGITRLVIRKTLNRTIAQAIDYRTNGDVVVATASSNELKKMGWAGSTSNSKAAYLTGLLLGKRANGKNVKTMILDIGLHPSTKGGKVYALLKGVVEAGIGVPHSKEMIPADERTGGEDVEKVKKAIMNG